MATLHPRKFEVDGFLCVITQTWQSRKLHVHMHTLYTHAYTHVVLCLIAVSLWLTLIYKLG